MKKWPNGCDSLINVCPVWSGSTGGIFLPFLYWPWLKEFWPTPDQLNPSESTAKISLSGQSVPYSDGRAGSVSLHVFRIKNRFCQGRQVGGPGSLAGSSRAGPGMMVGPIPGTASRLHALVLLCLDYMPRLRGGFSMPLHVPLSLVTESIQLFHREKKVKSICSCVC